MENETWKLRATSLQQRRSMIHSTSVTNEIWRKIPMPIIKSAKKRVRIASQAAVRNSKAKRALREAIKSLQSAIAAKDTKAINEAQKQVQSNLDKTVKKGLLHKNRAARKQKQLSAQAKAAGAKIQKTTTKKPAPTKKPTAKKTAPAKAVKKTVNKAPTKK